MPQYQLPDHISHSLGAYSARYPIHSFGNHTHISNNVPTGCDVIQVNILQRHGARYPTTGTGEAIASAVAKVKAAVTANPTAAATAGLAFAEEYTYNLGTDSLVDFGRLQAYESGQYIAHRYPQLTAKGTFVRTNSKPRILESSRWFMHGFEGGAFPFPNNVTLLPEPNVVIPISPDQNNTLAVETCPASEAAEKAAKTNPNEPDAVWLNYYGSLVADRLNAKLTGLSLNAADANNLMSLCGFDTAYNNGEASPWCGIFEPQEWKNNEYYWDLEKYYGFSYGWPWGATEGSGWVNELVGRLNGTSPVFAGAMDKTLDYNTTTFPIPPNSPNVFADFSSDNNIAHMIAALGILKDATPLPAKGPIPPKHFFVASKAVPFSTSLVVEKLSCSQPTIDGLEAGGEYVRMMLNEGIVPLQFPECGTIGGGLGMCLLADFITSQSFSQGGGDWNELCY
ncbi:hypothetical protein FRB90_011408 [Tulasnella sp. 427]|nr:hypothetical protein FRB90_011408 [Tulasnella sp. 427]